MFFIEDRRQIHRRHACHATVGGNLQTPFRTTFNLPFGEVISMNIKSLVGLSMVLFALSACESGDVNIDAENRSSTDNRVDNSISGDNSGNESAGGGSNSDPSKSDNPCATYSVSGVLRQGSYSAPNCIYGSDFVDLTNPITTTDIQVTFNNLPNSGVHVFTGSLVVGRNYNSDEDLAAAGISQGGDGAVIRIEAGATLAFRSSDDYMVINRGSQIFAEGAAGAPITITSVSDAVDGTVTPEAVSQWGGLIINGFGVTNKCAYTGTRGTDGFTASNCHVAAEGKGGSAQTHYGGANDDDSSGVLEYVVVKHTGAQVAPDNELNGISFDAVGRGTTINYLQTYSTFDDGIEMFGGAVDITNYIALYVRDDSIDIDEGYIGNITNALVIQSEADGQQCLESDGIGSYSEAQAEKNTDFIARGLNSAATLTNVTCIVSPNANGTHGVGAGLRIREGHFVKVYNSLVTTAYAADGVTDAEGNDDPDENQCIRIDNPETGAAADAGDLVVSASIFACHDLTKGGALPSGTSLADFISANNDVMSTNVAGENPESGSDENIVLLDGFYSLPLTDMIINGGPVTVTPVNSDIIGAVSAQDDWTAGWSYGLHVENRAQPLWFE